jgi:integrase
MKKRLTDRFLRTVTPPAAGRDVYVDSEAKGLEFHVSSHGGKSWSIRYRPKGGERKRSGYSTYPVIPLAKARARTLEIAAAAAHGIDLPEQEERQRDEERKATTRPQTFRDLLDRYVEGYCKPNQRRWQLTARLFDMHVTPTLGKKPLVELRRGDLVEMLDDLQNDKRLNAQVNRVRTALVAAFNWATERELIDTSPAAAIKRRKLETSRNRVLSEGELRRIWHVADSLPNPSRSFVKALILSGQRRDEVRLMQWSEIDLDRALWVLPAARNKGKRDHEIPLAPAMLALLGDRPRPGRPVFTANDRSTPYAGQQGLKEVLDRKSGVFGWTFHDLRRTASTGMAALHIPQDVIDRVLNHAKGTLAGTYNRHQYLEEKRRALEAWAERVAFIVGDGRDNVVELAVGTLKSQIAAVGRRPENPALTGLRRDQPEGARGALIDRKTKAASRARRRPDCAVLDGRD